jgi:hypothetical protein
MKRARKTSTKCRSKNSTNSSTKRSRTTLLKKYSFDWRAERKSLPAHLSQVSLQHSFIPRVGELVLWCPYFPDELDLILNPETGFFANSTPSTGNASWASPIGAAVSLPLRRLPLPWMGLSISLTSSPTPRRSSPTRLPDSASRLFQTRATARINRSQNNTNTSLCAKSGP